MPSLFDSLSYASGVDEKCKLGKGKDNNALVWRRVKSRERGVSPASPNLYMKTEICSMRGFTSVFSSASSFFLVQPFLPPLTLRSSSPSSTTRYYIISSSPNLYVSSPKPQLPKNIRLCSLPSSDPNYEFDYDCEIDDDAIPILSSSAESTTSEGVNIHINKLSRNSRRIVASVDIEAPLEEVWKVLTDYERLSDFIPGLALSRLLHKSPNFARLFQIGEQKLGLGLKFNAKGILDCYEKPLETITYGSGSGCGCGGTVSLKRDIHFRMVEGDFDIFQGKWSIIQQQQLVQVHVDRREEEGGGVERSRSRLWYLVDVKPKLWLPVGLVEGRLCNDVATNLASIRQQTHNNIST